MFPVNTNPWNSPFNASPFNTTPFAATTLLSNPFFQQTLNTLIAHAVQQAIWQTAFAQAQFQNTFNTQPGFNQNGAPFPFHGTFQNGVPNPFTSPWNTPQATGYGNPNPYNQPSYPSFTQPYPQAPQSTWLNTQPTQGYFGSTQFQQNNAPAHEPVEAVTKRNGSR
ncbi:MAG TPA: hypothetical protein VHN77_13570 [Phycisphaerales bacterium]|nr:hypothetical protein [Phycisphaerales bacterium]